MLNTFKFKSLLSSNAAQQAFAEQQEIVTIDNVTYDHTTAMVTVTTTHPITMHDADHYATQVSLNAPLTRIVMDASGCATDYVWCTTGDSEHFIENTVTGGVQWESTIEAVTQRLFDNDVYAPYAQFE